MTASVQVDVKKMAALSEGLTAMSYDGPALAHRRSVSVSTRPLHDTCILGV